MAIDDVVSDYDEQISNGARLDLAPSSGDEWLITHWLIETAGWDVNPHTDAGIITIGVFGGDATASSDAGELGLHFFTVFVTESEYFRLHNQTGATRNGGFSAIKTKD